jgi:hypothetical protein
LYDSGSVKWVYVAIIGAIVALWDESLQWIALGAFIALCVLIFLRGIVVRRHYEAWMDDLSRATFRLLLLPSVRVTTSWPGSANPPAAKPLPLNYGDPADPVVHVRRPRDGIREAFRPDRTPGTDV